MCNFLCGENRCWWIVIAALALLLISGCGAEPCCYNRGGSNCGGCGGCGGGCCPQ